VVPSESHEGSSQSVQLRPRHIWAEKAFAPLNLKLFENPLTIASCLQFRLAVPVRCWIGILSGRQLLAPQNLTLQVWADATQAMLVTMAMEKPETFMVKITSQGQQIWMN
jgi:hypothetical protein